jgi:hypothetical protein
VIGRRDMAKKWKDGEPQPKKEVLERNRHSPIERLGHPKGLPQLKRVATPDATGADLQGI